MKKVLSLVLALALVLSLTVTAFAAPITAPDEKGVYGGEADFTGTTEVPSISVTLPTEGAIVVNPYKMTVQDGNSVDSKKQIVSAASYIQNDSDVAVAIDATVTGSKGDGSEAVFATGPVSNNAKVTTKSVFMYFEVMKAADADTEPTWATAYNAKAENMIIVAEANPKTQLGIQKLNVVQLDADGGVAACHFAGDVAENPTKAWTATDTVSVNVAFTIRPVMNTDAPAATNP